MNPASSHNGKTPEQLSPTTKLFQTRPTRLVVRKKAGQIAAALAHEVRNPLTNINLAVELLGSTGQEHERKVFLDIIRRSVVRINHLIDELVRYQTAVQGKAESLSILQLLDEVLELAADRIRLKNISIRKLYDTEDFTIIVNKPKMKIAFTNIIVNAIDAMNAENGELKLITKSMETQYVVQIEDNGCGISKENLHMIFTPYYTNKPGGVGLGLATTYGILRSNHIGVNVESEEGKGTRFNLLLEKNNHSITKLHSSPFQTNGKVHN